MTFASQDSSLWHRFQSTKLSTQVASLLAAGNMQAATMLCSRHEVYNNLYVMSFFGALFATLPVRLRDLFQKQLLSVK